MTETASSEPRVPLREQFSQDRTMTTRLVLAIAADREVGPVRQRSQRVENVTGVRLLHLSAVTPDERLPRTFRVAGESDRNKLRTRRQIRKPDVVPVVRRLARARNTARRTPHSADAHAFITNAGSAQSDDSNGHD